MKPLVERVLENIRQRDLLAAGHRVGIAVSGGLDSVALLRLMIDLASELGIVPSVVHFNHQLRGAESDRDEQFVAQLAHQHNLAFHCDRADVRALSSENQLSLEAAARHARYEFFQRLLGDNILDRVATAHTLDDQAETLILRLARGAGTRGLAGIYPRVDMPNLPNKTIVRPLLGVRRNDLKTYLEELSQVWREDKSNRDLRHSRNRVRHGILPRMERHLNPSVREALAETAAIARDEEDYWQREAGRLLASLETSSGALKLAEFSRIPIALQRRVILHAAQSRQLRLEFKHVEGVLKVAAGLAASTQLSPEWVVCRRGNALHFEAQQTISSNYEYALPLAVDTAAPEAQARFKALLIFPDPEAPDRPLLTPSLLEAGLVIRNWRPGDRFWPLHAKSPKKIKELLQQRHISGPERSAWPVVAAGLDVVWLRGFDASAEFLAPAQAKQALLIRESPL